MMFIMFIMRALFVDKKSSGPRHAGSRQRPALRTFESESPPSSAKDSLSRLRTLTSSAALRQTSPALRCSECIIPCCNL